MVQPKKKDVCVCVIVRARAHACVSKERKQIGKMLIVGQSGFHNLLVMSQIFFLSSSRTSFKTSFNSFKT